MIKYTTVQIHRHDRQIEVYFYDGRELVAHRTAKVDFDIKEGVSFVTKRQFLKLCDVAIAMSSLFFVEKKDIKRELEET